MAPPVEPPAWTGPTELLPTVDGAALVRPYVRPTPGVCRWCARPIVLSPGRYWLHTDLKPECTDEWGWPVMDRLAEPRVSRAPSEQR